MTGVETTFRRESLGLVGNNHRYVWLAEGMSVEEARAILPEISRATDS